ncbi:hypothetical protein PAHAL_9G385900 [Panicum hallii]|jgi:hypothetical protein|uniref:Uncharacterized protein n=1 Tax=Panicum hallii TaxID=206008 RepID=A0A2S3INP3_9POAL|nr:hypothetical protein PAHAL_9G385900 [Panicum hallii]
MEPSLLRSCAVARSGLVQASEAYAIVVSEKNGRGSAAALARPPPQARRDAEASRRWPTPTSCISTATGVAAARASTDLA